MLSICHITKKFGSFTALSDVNLQLDHGVHALLAPNGAGKTTLMKLIVTLLFPNEGQILYNDSDILKLDAEYRCRIGYLPQTIGYYRNQNPEQYLDYIAALKGLSRRESSEKIPELLKLVHLDEVAKKKMKKFSGGMLQRVGIAQALLNDPEILILDEPTAGLDPKERVYFRNMISAISKNKIILLSTHIVSDIESIADNIILLQDKKVSHQGTPQEICSLLKGKVFETDVSPQLAQELENETFVLSRRQDENGVHLRLVSDMPRENWHSLPANLEDVFLWLYRESQVTAQ